jgi:hypothetical protein
MDVCMSQATMNVDYVADMVGYAVIGCRDLELPSSLFPSHGVGRVIVCLFDLEE